MKIVFFSPIDPSRRTGGVLVHFKSARLLRGLGFQTYVASFGNDAAPLDWFQHSETVLSWREACELPPGECVYVLPEDVSLSWHKDVAIGGHRLRLGQGNIVVFVQNRRDLYASLANKWPDLPPREATILNHPRTLGLLTVSAAEQQYCRAIYPDLTAWCKPNSVDCEMFRPDPGKENIAACLIKPGDTSQEARHLLIALRHSGLASGWRFLDLQGRPHREVAAALAKADIFLSFGVFESFGLVAAEAMASGCIVVGYHGGVAEEFFHPDWSYPVAPTDRPGYLQAFARMKADRQASPDLFEKKRAMGREHIRQNFSAERESAALREIFTDILGRIASR